MRGRGRLCSLSQNQGGGPFPPCVSTPPSPPSQRLLDFFSLSLLFCPSVPRPQTSQRLRDDPLSLCCFFESPNGLGHAWPSPRWSAFFPVPDRRLKRAGYPGRLVRLGWAAGAEPAVIVISAVSPASLASAEPPPLWQEPTAALASRRSCHERCLIGTWRQLVRILRSLPSELCSSTDCPMACCCKTRNHRSWTLPGKKKSLFFLLRCAR